MSTISPAPRYSIPYRTEYIQIAGTPMGAVLFQQLEYWSARYKSGFYKFLGIPKKFHAQYRAKDSWTEELGISEKVFRKAFDKIGIRYASKSDYSATEQPFIRDGQEFCFCSYYDKISHITYYRRNHAFANRVLAELLNESPEDTPEATNHAELPIGPLPNSPKDSSSLYTETTSENNNNTPAVEIPVIEAPAIIPPAETPVVKSTENNVLSANDSHFRCLNRYEVPAAQKMLQAIDLTNQQAVLQVLKMTLKKSTIKNKLGYLKALVKSVQSQSFMPPKFDKPKRRKPVESPEPDMRGFDVEASVRDLKAVHNRRKQKCREQSVSARQFFQSFKK